MCNLYTLSNSKTEVADFFDAIAQDFGLNAPEEVYPGYPGTVVAVGAVRQMVWGFPFARTGAKGQALKPRPVNNARIDKLDSFFWRYSFAERRCLIPVGRFAEAEGPKGGKTRTWFGDPDGALLAAAGIWRGSDEWGDCYSMIMTDANADVAPAHDRMPALLTRDDWAIWCDGDPDTARALCRPYSGALTVDRSSTPWAGPHV